MGSLSIWHWIIVLLVVGLPVVAVLFFVKRSKTRDAAQPEQLVGIGGWLILPIIGFVGTILLTGFNFLQTIKQFDGIKAIFSVDNGPIVSLKLPLGASLLLGLGVFVSAALCLYYIISIKKGVTKIATGHYIILALAGIADFWADSVLRQIVPSTPPDPTILRDAIRGLLIAAIWIPYFWLSKRVQNTFEKPRSAETSAVEEPRPREISQ